MDLYRETKSGVVGRLHLIDQVRHHRLTEEDVVPDSIKERLMEILESWNASADDATAIPRNVRAEASVFARELRARGLSITERHLLRDSVVEGWRIVRGRYSDSQPTRSGGQG